MSIPSGTYRGKGVLNSEQLGRTPNGTEQIVLELELVVPMAGDVEERKRVSTFLYFSEKAAPYSIERLQALGWTGDDVGQPLVGIDRNEVDVSVSYETFEGKERMRVDILTGGGRVQLKHQMNDAERRQFGARFKSLVKSAQPSAAQQPLQSTGTGPRF